MRTVTRWRRLKIGLCAFGLGSALIGAAALADEKAPDSKPELKIELNALEQRGKACRLSFLVSNKTGVALQALAFELVLFDKTQRILSLVAADAGALPKGKTRVKQFDIAERDCATIGRLLLNDVTKCAGGALAPQTCLEQVTVSSLATVPLVY